MSHDARITDTRVPPDIRDFFEHFSSIGDSDPAAAAELFSDPFLNLDPHSSTVVTSDQLAAALPMRARMFSSIGAEGTELSELDVREIDARHALVRTAWRVRLTDEAAAPLTLHSTFLLRREDGRWSVAVYINHADMAAVIRDRQQALPRVDV